jgi:hypothetical protein
MRGMTWEVRPDGSSWVVQVKGAQAPVTRHFSRHEALLFAREAAQLTGGSVVEVAERRQRDELVTAS